MNHIPDYYCFTVFLFRNDSKAVFRRMVNVACKTVAEEIVMAYIESDRAYKGTITNENTDETITIEKKMVEVVEVSHA